MSFRRLLELVVLAFPLISFASGAPDPSDNSRAGTDGPHVFYRGDKITVKYVVMRDTGATAVSQTFSERSAISLTCSIPETGDKFTFQLHDKIEVPADTYPAKGKILALSDIEGNFKALKMILQGAGVMDEQFNWIFGNGDLVLIGDFFDRGVNVTECLWLLYKLEAEAASAGGRVHFILGNHEVINLQANTLYVRRKYLENVKLLGMDYKFWFDSNSELGRWLRSKNAIEKIGDYAFCHGGISTELTKTNLSIQDINRIARQNLGKQDYNITNKDAQAIFDTKTGVFWFRGLGKNQVPAEEIPGILKFIGAKRLVIGHTLQSDLTALYGGKVLCIDLYHEENLRQGFIKTLWIEDGYCYTIDSRGDKASMFSISFPRKSNE